MGGRGGADELVLKVLVQERAESGHLVLRQGIHGTRWWFSTILKLNLQVVRPVRRKT